MAELNFYDQYRERKAWIEKVTRGLILILLSALGTTGFLYWLYVVQLGTFYRPMNSSSPATSISHKQFNFHLISPTIWRSAQPNAASLDRLRTFGLKTIVNLVRRHEEQPWEKVYAETHGIAYLNFPMDAREAQDMEQIGMILDTVRDPSRQPVLIHCVAGKDRTGLVGALYRIEVDRWHPEQALNEMLMYGYDLNNLPELRKALKIWSATKSD